MNAQLPFPERERLTALEHALLAACCSSIMACSQQVQCPPPPCEPAYNLHHWCAATGLCELDGVAVTSCDCCGKTPECPLWHLQPGVVLTIPLGKAQPELGARDDLEISFEGNGTLPDIQLTTVLLDGVPWPCERANGIISCNDVGAVQRLDLNFDDVAPDAERLTHVEMRDLACPILSCPR